MSTVYKELIVFQDLAFGEGQTTQNRNGEVVTVDKIAFDMVFSTKDDMKNSTVLTSGMTVKTKGYHESGDLGSAVYLIKTLAEFGSLPDEIGDHTLANNNVAVLQTGSVVSVDQYGAVGDGVTDSYSSINACFKNNESVIFGKGAYVTTQQLVVEHKIIIDLNGVQFLGAPGGDTTSWFWFLSDEVTIKNGIMGNGNIAGKPIIFGDYTNKYTSLRVYNIKFNMPEMGDNRGIVAFRGASIDCYVDKCEFYGNNILSPNLCAVIYQIGASPLVDRNTVINMNITNCISDGIPTFFNNYSNEFASTFTIEGNTIKNAGRALRAYHLFKCIVSENTFIDCTDYTYIWQRTTCVNNVWDNCGDLGTGCVKVETPASTIFDGNEIRNGKGHGIIVDGGAANTALTNNSIYNCTGDGINVNPNFAYGGQVFQLRLDGNYIRQNFGNGISIVASSAIRGIHITNNHISANGFENPSEVSGILLDNSVNNGVSRLLIKDNIIANSDPGVGTVGNTTWGYKYLGTVDYIAQIMHNAVYTDVPFLDNTSPTALGNKFIAFNLVNDPKAINVNGTITQGAFPAGQMFNIGYTNGIVDGQGDLRINGISNINATTPDFIGQKVFNRDITDPSYYIAVAEDNAGTVLTWRRMTP